MPRLPYSSTSPCCRISCPRMILSSFSWHTHPLLTHGLCLFCSSSLCTQLYLYDLLSCFAKPLVHPRKRYRKAVRKQKKQNNTKNPNTPKIDSNLVFALPFARLPAGRNSHPCSLVCFLWLLVSWEHLNSWILCKPIFI